MKLNAVAVTTRYAVEIPLKVFKAFIAYENSQDENKLVFELDNNSPALDVEYDGMFLNYIWFSLNREDDTLEEREHILFLITEYLEAI